MRYGQIRKYDVANGPGIRSSFFVTGCTHHCPECFNEEYQDFNFGEIWTDKETKTIIEYLLDEQINGLTILGGEPFQNVEDLIEILTEIKKHTNKNIWIYSGYTYDELILDERKKILLNLCNVLVDGLFINELKDLKLRFKGSSNQRIIDLDKTRQNNEITLWE